MPSTTKETPDKTSGLCFDTALCPYKYKTLTEIPDEQMKRTNKQREKYKSMTSRLEQQEELQQHHNNEKNLLLTVLLLFA
jgi:transcriptional/translational regulatory protein YebC/TACO1